MDSVDSVGIHIYDYTHLHQAFTPLDTTQSSDTIESYDKGMLYVYHHFTDKHKIEFPFLCKVDLTSTAVGLGHEWLVYGDASILLGLSFQL